MVVNNVCIGTIDLYTMASLYSVYLVADDIPSISIQDNSSIPDTVNFIISQIGFYSSGCCEINASMEITHDIAVNLNQIFDTSLNIQCSTAPWMWNPLDIIPSYNNTV